MLLAYVANLPFMVRQLNSIWFAHRPLVGESSGESATHVEAPPIWNAWKKMLADIFFFFEYDYLYHLFWTHVFIIRYLHEDGGGSETIWTQGRNRILYQHSANSRLAEEDRDNYATNIAIRDSSG